MLLVWGRFGVSKTIIPEAWEHFLTPSTRPSTHLFGGLGFKPGSACFYADRGPARYHLAEYQTALEDLSRALDLNASDARAYFCRGFTHLALNERLQAIEDLEMALQLEQDPSFREEIREALSELRSS